MRRFAAGLVAIAVSFLALTGAGGACSRVLFVTKTQGVYAARSMDWHEIFDPEMMIYPRGMQLSGGVSGNPAMWTSKYGSLIVNGTNYDDAAVDEAQETLSGSATRAILKREFHVDGKR